MFPLGPVTLRMVLFFACLAIWLLAVIMRKRLDGQGLAILLILFFFASHLSALFVDANSSAPAEQILGRIQPILFWFSAPFIALAINSHVIIKHSANIIMYGGSVVALVIIASTAALLSGVLNPRLFYTWGAISGEFFFRSDTYFFFKGHFYVGMALVFSLLLRPKGWPLMASILTVALVASLTRGLILAVLVAIVFGLITNRRTGMLFIIFAASVVAAGFYGPEIIESLFGDKSREISLLTRVDDLNSFVRHFDLRIFFFGDGFGPLLNGRESIENSYLWAIWRFGVIGLIFWLSPFFVSYYYYRKIPKYSDFYALASTFFAGMLMLFLLTSVNPFINNSIGLLYALISIFALRRLSLLKSDEPNA